MATHPTVRQEQEENQPLNQQAEIDFAALDELIEQIVDEAEDSEDELDPIQQILNQYAAPEVQPAARAATPPLPNTHSVLFTQAQTRSSQEDLHKPTLQRANTI